MKEIRIFIIDDQIDFIKGILHLFRNDTTFKFVGYETDGVNFLKNINPTEFDVLLVDIKMPKISGIELIQNLIIRFSYIKTIIFSIYYDFDNIEKAVGAGAKGYVVKSSSKEIIKEAITEVYNNGTFFQLKPKEEIKKSAH